METNPSKDPISRWLNRGGQAIYVAIGISFLFAAVLTLIFAWVNFIEGIHRGVLHAVIGLVNDILLILIILEVLETILSYLKSHAILLEPFLYIGIIASVRRILASGAHLTILESEGRVSQELFQTYLLDIGVNTLVIVVLVFSVFLFSKRKQGA